MEQKIILTPTNAYISYLPKDIERLYSKTLVAYCDIGFFGEFSLVAVLLGHKKFLNDGIMNFMLIELMKLMFEKYQDKGYNYIMYDTFLGATEGLQRFKRKLGYKPYNVNWKWEK